MRTAVLWAKCWLLLTTISNIYSTGDVAHNLIDTEVEFDGLGPGDNSTEIKKNDYINFTVHINDQTVFQIKISHQHNNLSVDLCKFGLRTVCDASDSSNATSHCKCLSNNTVPFLKKASSSDSGLYTWRWLNGKTTNNQRDIFVNVKEVNPDTSFDETASAATTSTTVCVLLTVVVMATAGLVVWMRNKVKYNIDVKNCGQDYHSKGSDHAVDNQVNGQTLNTVENPHSPVVKEPTANHIHDPNYAEVNDAIQLDDPDYSDIKEEDKNQPPESSYYEINIESRSADSAYAYVKKKGKSQSTDPTKPCVNSKDASQPLDPYYSDIKEPSMSHAYDNNHTNDTENDESHNYDPNYADINDHITSQPPDPDYSDVNQHATHNYDPKYIDIKVEENSKADDPNYAHVKKRIKRHPDHSTDAQVETGDMIPPDNLFCDEVKKQNRSLAVDTTYPHNKGQDTDEESVYSPKNKQKPVSSHNNTYVEEKEDTTDRGGFVYNHLHKIHQHDDLNYDHIETKETASCPHLPTSQGT